MQLITYEHTCSGNWDRPKIIDGDGNKVSYYSSVRIFFSSDIIIRGKKGESEITIKGEEGTINISSIKNKNTQFPYEIKAEGGTVIQILANN